MGSKSRLSFYCTKRGDNSVNLVTSHKTIARLARPIECFFGMEGHVALDTVNRNEDTAKPLL